MTMLFGTEELRAAVLNARVAVLNAEVLSMNAANVRHYSFKLAWIE